MPAGGDARPGEAIDWALIPPRPRARFWTICLFILGKGERTGGAGHLVPATTERGTEGGGSRAAREFRERPVRGKDDRATCNYSHWASGVGGRGALAVVRRGVPASDRVVVS